jgi:polyribonucleotide nucleotidyltransferase
VIGGVNKPVSVEISWEGKPLKIETGRVAKQAHGSVVVYFGETMVLVTAVRGNRLNAPQPFLPLTVNYMEQTYAAGKIPGGFFKREGKPTEKEVHISRLIDRPIRPLFPKGYPYEVQVIATVVSADPDCDPDVGALIGASSALSLSPIPFKGPLAGIRIGRVDGNLVVNPSYSDQCKSDLDLVVAVKKDSIVMVEGGAKFVPEEVILSALNLAFEKAQPVLDLQEHLLSLVQPKKEEYEETPLYPSDLFQILSQEYGEKIRSACSIPTKQERNSTLKALEEEAIARFGKEGEEDRTFLVQTAFEDLKRGIVRRMIKEGRRVDGRDHNTVRPIEISLSYLPRAHGSALFTRGETQALVSVTLGSQEDEQKLATLYGEGYKRFYLHYNFPPYCVGEVRPLRAPGRREIGHGLLAERAVAPILPEVETFPYTIRVVSDITESNGSSSMATVCGASLALMDAGVPVKTHVAGVAMGLIREDNEYLVLTDILGDEDHLGDMDFKVAGSREGVTALQMDIKISGISPEIMAKALDQALKARLHILDLMEKAISVPRPELKPFVPRVEVLTVPVERIGDIIGPGGKTIRSILQETGVKIDIDDRGLVKIYSSSIEGIQKARKRIEEIIKEVQPGETYVGTVKKIADFGAFVEILPGTQGLVHISEVADRRIRSVREVLREGDQVKVMVLDIDPQGRIRLSIKRASDSRSEEAETPPPGR